MESRLNLGCSSPGKDCCDIDGVTTVGVQFSALPGLRLAWPARRLRQRLQPEAVQVPTGKLPTPGNALLILSKTRETIACTWPADGRSGVTPSNHIMAGSKQGP